MPTTHDYKKKRARLIRQINETLDFVIGSISTKGLKYPAYNLTTKIDGVTRTRHIPRDMLPAVQRMTLRHKTLKRLLKELSDVNWKLVCEGELLENHGTV